MYLYLLPPQSPLIASEPLAKGIQDNSFFIEEAYNQEPGVVQHIFNLAIDFTNGSREIGPSFTQEWPVFSQTHQFSYTVGALGGDGAAGMADLMINYRWQAAMESASFPAFSPRVSLILATGDADRGFGSGGPGWQVNLPFSKQTNDWYWHWNVGLTWLERAKASFQDGDLRVVRRDQLASPFFAGSAIYRLRPMFHLMLESVLNFDETIEELDVRRETIFTLSPGVRAGWDIGDKQVVLGVAVPITWTSEPDAGVFVYASYELPFKKN